ncbi:MAG: cupin domain-containing protein [Gammaproteobacteria bacterium]
MHTRYNDIATYITKDGSSIRELMHPTQHGNRNQSLAEATVPVGARTRLHRHERSEEIYYILAGEGLMTLGDASFPIVEGDSVCIAAGTAHCIANVGAIPLRILCACAPAYAHGDTIVIEEPTDRG